MTPALRAGDRVRVVSGRHPRNGEIGIVVRVAKFKHAASVTVRFADVEHIIAAPSLRRVEAMA
jgi:ribosomal protein L24